MLPDAAAAHYLQQQRLTVATLGLTRAAWGRMTPDFDLSWRTVGPRLSLVALSAQLGAARAAEPYLAAVLPQVGLDNDPAGAIVPETFVGAAGDGRPVDTLLYGAVTTAKEAVRGRSFTEDGTTRLVPGLGTRQALALGGRWLDMAVHTLVADTSRAAVQVGMVARPRVTGYVRMLNPPSCGRCAILAGRWYRVNEGFARHPRCDCRHIPVSEDRAGDLRTDPQKAFDAGQVRGLTAAQERAVRDGGDMAQVVNSRRGMDTASSLTTREAAGRRARLTPEAIYRQAGDDRPSAIALLRQHGYIT